MSDRCETCGGAVYSGPPDCPTCGAPNCCRACCEKTTDAAMRWKFFGDSPRGATFSPCRTWRYALWRRWNDSRIVEIDNSDVGPDFQRMVAFVGLNPSTADEMDDDKTITRCINFAKSWGFDGLCMLNLFAFCTKDPKILKRAPDPIGPENDECLRRAIGLFGKVVAAWGNDGVFRNRHYGVRHFMWPSRMWHLGLTKTGCPKHPLYLKATTQPIRWETGR